MKDPKHTPMFCIFGTQLLAAGIPFQQFKDPRPALPVFGCNLRFGPAANDPQERPTRA